MSVREHKASEDIRNELEVLCINKTVEKYKSNRQEHLDRMKEYRIPKIFK
jgi:uncharacterized protein involved in tolerance to divalent cations